MMTDKEWLDKLKADLHKMKVNREKIPLDVLKTRFERAYNTLEAELECDADWWADRYLEVLPFPLHPEDEAGNEWFRKKCDAIKKEENQPGRLRDQWRKALALDLDPDKMKDLAYKRYERLLQEAFMPYWKRHNRWIGEPGKRWIYNDIFRKFWWPKTEGYPASGCWINSDYTGHDSRYPPNIKEE